MSTALTGGENLICLLLQTLVRTTLSRINLSRNHSTNPTALQQSLHIFSTWLSSLEVVHSSRLAQPTVQRLQSKVHHDALVRLAKTYQMIFEEEKKPENKYEAASTLLGE